MDKPMILERRQGKRKTVSILALLREVNRRNRDSTCKAEIRQGWNSILETILHANNLYRGFGYLTAEEIPAGQEPGIIREGNTAYTGKPVENPHLFPDETRRFYYIDGSLTKGEKRS